MSDPILDADIHTDDAAYKLLIEQGDAVQKEAEQWYTEAIGHAPARSDIWHGTWRGLKENARWKTLRHAFQDTWPKPVEPGPIPTPGTVRPWHRDGLNLKDDTGALVKVRGVTAFDAFRLYCAGDFSTLTTYAHWTRSLGAETWRVFLMWRNTGLTSTPLTRSKIRPFVDWCHANGIRPWLVGFCDQTSDSPILLSPSEQDAHWAAVRDALDDRSIGEVVNEAWKNGGNDFSARFNLSGIPLAMRSTPQDGEDPRVCGAIHTLTNDHTPRDAEWARKFKVLLETARMGSTTPDGATIEATGVPALAGEPRRLNEVTAQDAADYYAGCELYGEGGILHDGADLQYCRVPVNQAVYQAAAASWGVIPAHLAAQGTYSRDDHNQVIDAPFALRNYAMIDGSTAWAVCPGGNISAAVGVNGWVIEKRLGFEGRIVRLTKG